MELTPEDQLILASVKIKPSKIDLDRINNLIPLITDWQYLIQTIILRGIGPLFLNKIPSLPNKTLIPEEAITYLQQTYYLTLSRSMVLYNQFHNIAEAFNAQHIQAIALKGVYLSETLYHDISLRQFSDIDLLVKPEDGAKCLKILEEIGFKSVRNNNVTDFIESKSHRVHFAPMVLNEVSVEIHTKLHRDNEKYQIQLDACWKDCAPVTISRTALYALSLADLIIHLCIHLDKHFREGHVQFTCFNDITNLLEKNAKTFDWQAFIERCKLHNCELEVMKYLLMTHKFMFAPIPEKVVQTYSSALKAQDEIQFLEYLHGLNFKIVEKSAIPVHLENLQKLESTKEFLRYFADLIFPPKSFMIEKYNIKKPSMYLLFYPYRYFIGIKGFISIILKKQN